MTRVCRRWREVYLRDALRALRLATSNMHAAAAGGAGSPGTPTSRRKAWLAGKAGLLRQRGGLIEELAVEDGGCELFGGAPAQPSLAEERGCWPAEEFAALLPRTLGALSWSAEAPPPPPIWEALPSLARLTSLT